MLEVTLSLNPDSTQPLYIQIFEYIKHEMIQGKISAGTRLPSIRQLSEHLRVSRNTIETAYQQLIMEGYVESRPRSGLYVVDVNQDDVKLPGKSGYDQSPIDKSESQLEEETENIRIDFRYGNVDAEHFPFHTWRKLTLEALHPNHKRLFIYGNPQGEQDLRFDIAKYLRHSRGVNCTAEQVVIGSGIQSLLNLLSLMIKAEGRIIAMENPGYDGARRVFEAQGLAVAPISLDKQGLNVKELYHSMANTVYITPSHQFPCGMTMPVARRMALLNWAYDQNGLIIEDDYDGEFRYNGRPIPALQGLDQHQHVVYVGSFSKSLLPSLRISYMILPPTLIERYRETFLGYDTPVSYLHQKTLQLFMSHGHWERHLRRMRKVYRSKQTVLLDALSEYLGTLEIDILGQDAGLHILLRVRNGLSEKELVDRASRHQVKVYPISHHWADPLQAHLNVVQLGFGGLTEDEIIEGVQSLAQAWKT
ncbi:PLP-dependent aminotransferase family protein [Caldalkalibacillus salinus]|uniref:MocR-like pyridoxine biosynthesis transcription factor PdxR n=1 Tax=Caldalkalibacillus salinus TaxID=2803787 RepID=UPI001920EF4E|nr:PLP-dependent aminotransferase family protein [Caldalkalibacillus salinus]